MKIDDKILEILKESNATDQQIEATLTQVNKMTWTQKVDYKRRLKEQRCTKQ